MSITYKLIRGARIEQQILAEDSSVAQLQQRTYNFAPKPGPDARQNAVAPIQIAKVELIPARSSNNLTVKVTTNSNGHTYQPSMMFNGVIFDDADQNDNTSFKAADNKEYHIVPIDLNKTNVKVHCNCLDFYYRFAPHNSTDGSLLGNPPPPYQKHTNRPLVNPQKVPGLCKHLLKAVDALKNVRIVR